ncbi:ATP-grasp domain-containing protein [Antribacter sp. KLBMP9083]|uniref:ATP-grasp domain-containing protein n=1 Tax=Antribacter soli TaxID=2910976 RepID=A0AA41QG20_9MICO|nr:biotin carboxylase N-terminal domain-containing protein [Antribacter soli]MCF4121986.1 ATP-grasp domain-containing protein [Antribacter soli]
MHTLLVANRGEIALRVLRTARRLGLRTVAVYSDADRDAPHVRAADVAVRVGPGPAAESYLSIPALLAAAERTGADAVHPGYGFLAENAGFAQAVLDTGLVWVGPPPDAMAAMGRKDTAREIALAAGVPVLQQLPVLPSDAGRSATIGDLTFPLLVKAAAGGGGKGMRVVRDPAGLDAAVAAARREAGAAFGDDTVLLERYVEHGRHVEVQVLADAHGHVVHLHERDCSAQRRHQKVLEEAPAPWLTPGLRERLHAWAVELAAKVGYVGAGTVEFLVPGDPGQTAGGEAWFLEMNTRLQVEHPVTEAVVIVAGRRLDLVAEQLRIAAGEPLGFTQAEVNVVGHAMEARINAEDAYAGFLPQAGIATRVRWPAGVRVDAGIEDGTVVPAAYDSLVGKVIARGEDREAARQALVGALDNTAILGLTTNTGFLRALADSAAFRDGEVDTAWLDGHEVDPPDPWSALVAAAWAITSLGGDGWRAGGPPGPAWVELGEHVLVVARAPSGEGEVREASGAGRDAAERAGVVRAGVVRAGVVRDAGDGLLEVDGVVGRFVVEVRPRAVEVAHRGHTFRFARPDGSSVREAEAGDGVVLAVMPGTLTRVDVRPGERVKRGQALGVLEAMKMELALTAPADGVVTVGAAAGERVAARQVLFEVHDPGASGKVPGA